jgi:hypothetical protein
MIVLVLQSVGSLGRTSPGGYRPFGIACVGKMFMHPVVARCGAVGSRYAGFSHSRLSGCLTPDL